MHDGNGNEGGGEGVFEPYWCLLPNANVTTILVVVLITIIAITLDIIALHLRYSLSHKYLIVYTRRCHSVSTLPVASTQQTLAHG